MNVIQEKKAHRKFLAVVNYLILVAVAAILMWILVEFEVFHSSATTDNAQVRRQILPINSRVEGYINKINVREYQHVNEGDVLMVVDASEYQLKLKQAEASHASALAKRDVLLSSIDTLRNNLLVSDSSIAEAEVRLKNAQTELKRNEALLKTSVVTQSQYDAAETEANALQINRDKLAQQKKSISLSIKEQEASLREVESTIQQTQAAVDMANLYLSYTQIKAPCSGYLGRKAVESGQLIQPGQTVFDIVDDDDTWVVANFKEKVVGQIGVGTEVEIRIDAYEGVSFKGVVSALSDATGASYSLIPADNSTGNFVKIEQLVPVRITFADGTDAEKVSGLKNGMSATVRLLNRI